MSRISSGQSFSPSQPPASSQPKPTRSADPPNAGGSTGAQTGNTFKAEKMESDSGPNPGDSSGSRSGSSSYSSDQSGQRDNVPSMTSGGDAKTHFMVNQSLKAKGSASGNGQSFSGGNDAPEFSNNSFSSSNGDPGTTDIPSGGDYGPPSTGDNFQSSGSGSYGADGSSPAGGDQPDPSGNQAPADGSQTPATGNDTPQAGNQGQTGGNDQSGSGSNAPDNGTGGLNTTGAVNGGGPKQLVRKNNEQSPIKVGMFENTGPGMNPNIDDPNNVFNLQAGETKTLSMPTSWQGRAQQLTGGAGDPATWAEINYENKNGQDKIWYDNSMIRGYNAGVTMAPTDGSGPTKGNSNSIIGGAPQGAKTTDSGGTPVIGATEGYDGSVNTSAEYYLNHAVGNQNAYIRNWDNNAVGSTDSNSLTVSFNPP